MTSYAHTAELPWKEAEETFLGASTELTLIAVLMFTIMPISLLLWWVRKNMPKWTTLKVGLIKRSFTVLNVLPNSIAATLKSRLAYWLSSAESIPNIGKESTLAKRKLEKYSKTLAGLQTKKEPKTVRFESKA